MTTQVRKRCAVELSVRALFEQPTLAGFAAHVDSLRATESAEPAVAEIAEPAVAEDAEPIAAALSRGGSRRYAPGEETFPLSFPQQQLLFFDALEPGSVTYNAALAIRVLGELDEAVLRQALEAVIERHEALRTVLVWDEASGRQVVLDRWEAELASVDLTSVQPRNREPETDRLLRAYARRPFDLSNDPMLRTTVFHVTPDEHIVLFQTHHVAFDAWAVEILYRDLGELYTAALEGREARLPELPQRYGEFARRQRERLQGEFLERELDFWRVHLAGAPTHPGADGEAAAASADLRRRVAHNGARE